MTRVLIDANVFIYNNDSESPLYKQANELLAAVTGNEVEGVCTPYVLNEIHYFYLRLYGAKKANELTRKILGLPGLEMMDIGLEKKDMLAIFRLAEKYRLKTFDAFHAYYCKKLKIKMIVSFDRDFDRVAGIKYFQPAISQ